MSTTQVRRFGTDVSNIQTGQTNHALKKSETPKSTLKGFESAKAFIPIVPPVEATKSARESNVEEIPLDDEIFLNSPRKGAEYCRYERDYLLGFQQFCMEPLDGLIAEVMPGYVPPVVDEESTSYSKFNGKSGHSKYSSPLRKSTSGDFRSPNKDSTTPTKGSHQRKSSVGSPSFAIPPVGHDERVPEIAENRAGVTPAVDASGAIAPTNLVMEWRAKAKASRKSKPRESDARRLAARQKQIDIGMNTVGYRMFLEAVPPEMRTKDHPRIPDIYQICSKRSWDGQVRKWRRQLHQYDPESAGQNTDDLNGDENDELDASADDQNSEEEYSFDEGEDEQPEQTVEASDHSV